MKRLALRGFFVLAAWIAAYVFIQRPWSANSPFRTEDAASDAARPVPGSRTPLTLPGRPLFVLETRHAPKERPCAVFVPTSPDGRVAWARTPLVDFGPIDPPPGFARWHAGGLGRGHRGHRSRSGQTLPLPAGADCAASSTARSRRGALRRRGPSATMRSWPPPPTLATARSPCGR